MFSQCELQHSSSNADIIQPLKLKDEAFITLERLIVTGELAPGQWVSETDLIEASGHKRASVRSAIQRLSDQGLISIFPRRGTQICPIDYTQQFRALELRRVVEKLISSSAAKRASDSQKATFAKISDDFREAALNADQTAMTELDLKNYSLMLQAADNTFASKAMTSVKGLSRRFWVLHQEKHGDVSQMADVHANVASAIASGKAEEAEKATSKVIDYVEKFTLEVVGYS